MSSLPPCFCSWKAWFEGGVYERRHRSPSPTTPTPTPILSQHDGAAGQRRTAITSRGWRTAARHQPPPGNK